MLFPVLLSNSLLQFYLVNMGKLIEFSIGFTNIDHAVLTPGQALCGNVVVNLRDSMNLKGMLSISFCLKNCILDSSI